MSGPMMFSEQEKAECAKREVKMRERVYPRWVQQGKMTQQQADLEIAMMREIAEEYSPAGLFGSAVT